MYKIITSFDFNASQIIDLINNNCQTMALPTGNTPIGMYLELKKRNIDWKKVKVFMLDVNYPQNPAEPTSFYSFAQKYLPSKKFNILNSQTKDPEKECREYEEKIKAAGGLDLAVLGIGENGHLAYNEPGTDWKSLTHMAKLSLETIKINKLKMQYGLTMGIKTIMSAKKIILLAKGADKAAIVKRAVEGPMDKNCPASILQTHPDVTFILDQEAASLLK